jgi:hypothetical protein
VPKTFEDWKVKEPLLRELRLTKNRHALFTDAGLASWRATAALLDKLDISEGLAAYSDISSACRQVLEDCLSNSVEPEGGNEYLQMIAGKIEATIVTYTHIVPIFGVALKGIDQLNLGTLKILPVSKELIDKSAVQYSAEHLDHALEQMKPYLWLMGVTKGTPRVSRERFVAKTKLVTGLLAVAAASRFEQGSHGFRIGAITTPEEGHGRAVSLSWSHSDMELQVGSRFVRAQPLEVDADMRVDISESPLGIRALGILESDDRSDLEETWVKALFWYSDAHRDQIPVMRLLKFWSCAETFFSGNRVDITESVSFGLAASMVYGNFRFFEPQEFETLKKRLKHMYADRSAAAHRASYTHVSDKDVADLSQWISWMLFNMVVLIAAGVKTPQQAIAVLRQRAGFTQRRMHHRLIAATRRLLAPLLQRFGRRP